MYANQGDTIDSDPNFKPHKKAKWTFGRSWRNHAEIQDTLFIVSPVVQL